MEHAYLTEAEIQNSLAAGAITNKEAKELIVKLKKCARGAAARKTKGAVLNLV